MLLNGTYIIPPIFSNVNIIREQKEPRVSFHGAPNNKKEKEVMKRKEELFTIKYYTIYFFICQHFRIKKDRFPGLFLFIVCVAFCKHIASCLLRIDAFIILSCIIPLGSIPNLVFRKPVWGLNPEVAF